MTRIIYADLLFFINLSADFVIIFLTGVFSGVGCSFFRMLSGAFLGAAVGTAVICSGNAWASSALIVFILPAVLCFTVFGKRSFKAFVNFILWFYFSSVILYGGTYAMASAISILLSANAMPSGFIFTLILIFALLFMYLLFSSFLSHGIKRRENQIKAEISDGLKSYNLTLLVDSGNLARDPFSAKPVVIVNKNALDAKLINAITQTFDNDASNHEYRHIKPRVIPMKTVSGTTLLYAFIPESMYIYRSNKKVKADCIIAIDTHENSFFGKDGIIPDVLLQTI